MKPFKSIHDKIFNNSEALRKEITAQAVDIELEVKAFKRRFKSNEYGDIQPSTKALFSRVNELSNMLSKLEALEKLKLGQ